MADHNPIFYFSGTGGCLATAKSLSEQLDGFSPVPIAAFKNGYTVDADVCGFVFPLYYAGLPDIVAKFIKKIQFSQPCYVFAVVACGFPWSGLALHQINSLLRRQKQSLSAGFYLKMTDNFLPHYDVPSAEHLTVIYNHCEAKLRKIVSSVKERERILEPDKALYLYVMYPFFIRALKRYDRHFKTDDRCSGCGLCQKVCPVENIILSGGKPEWQHHCEFCQACISFCPQKSIQWKNVTQTKGRYHYKGVTARQIEEQKQSARPE